MSRILVVDDQANMRATTALMLSQAGYEVEEASGGPEALEAVGARTFDVVITDLRMTPMGGLELVSRLREDAPSTQVLVMTAYGSVESAVEAMRRGAADYIQKPFSEEELLLRVARAVEQRQLLSTMAVAVLDDGFRERHQLQNVIGRSPALRELLGRVVRIAPTDATVLITGESGTGKEVVARAIHANSRRTHRPFVPVNCAAIHEQLLESELFGHAKGAFTGAMAARRGLFEEADGGTFFFDEIAETNTQLQAKLLRAIQEHEIRRVGENSPIHVDVRIIAATNVDLRVAIEEKRFREDLYYRLNVVPIRVPPLRERKEDIPLLVQHFLERFNKRNRTNRTIGMPAIERLMGYDFPGNVRELENLVEQSAALASSDEIQPGDFILEEQPGSTHRTPEAQAYAGDKEPSFSLERGGRPMTLAEIVAEAERVAITRALERHAGHQDAAARDLEISHTTLWRKMRKLGLSSSDR